MNIFISPPDADRNTRPQVQAAEHAVGSAAHAIGAIFALLDDHAIAYCIPHGWEGLPERWGSDIDVIVARHVTYRDLLRLFDDNAQRIGAKVARARKGFITFRCIDASGLPLFVNFDFCHDYHAGAYLVSSGEALLAGRIRRGAWWTPSPGTGFATGLVRALLTDRLDGATMARLEGLHAEAPGAAKEMLAEFLMPEQAVIVNDAAASGNWSAVTGSIARWQNAMKWRLLRRFPTKFLRKLGNDQAGRLGRLVRPQGFHVVLLGPDGAGKSSTIAALETVMTPLFARTEVKGFAPTLQQILRRQQRSTSTPHALKPRSLPTSLLRAAWWTVFALASHVSLRYAKVRSTLVLNDRHFIDILVDPLRYRYGGPRWLLGVIARLMPRPDAVILLHGPAEILQARKKELTVEETARQCRDYHALVSVLPMSHILDATQPFASVVTAAADIVLGRVLQDEVQNRQ